MSNENKSIPVNYRFTKDLINKIEKFQEQKSKELGLKLSKNQSVEMLLSEALTLNNIN